MSSGGKGSKKSTSTSVQQIQGPEYLDAAYRFGTDEARRLYDEGLPEFYPGQTYADFDPLQEEAMDATVAMAREGSPLIDSAQGWAQGVLDTPSGQNPYLDQLVDKYARDANKMVMSNFNKSGRMGSGANVATAGREIAEATLPFLFDQYNTDQNLKYNVAGMSPMLAEQDYIDLDRINAVGATKQGQVQRGIDEDVARYNWNENLENMALDQYLQRVYANPAQNWTTATNTTTTKQKSGGGLGSALGTALSLGSMFVPGGQLAALGSLGGSAGFGLATGGQALGAGGFSNMVNATRGFYGPGF